MTPDLTHYYVARIALETVTPLSVSAGGADGVFDIALVRDANGLPAVPGSTIAGVLRHLYWELHQQDGMEDLFGYQHGDQGQPSRLHISWGAIQDSKGVPVEGLLLGKVGKDRLTDTLLRAALATDASRATRDRVRIGHRGAAAHTGKFDRAVLPAGYRFSAELALWSDLAKDPHWQQVLDLHAHPLFRLGGGTRAGLGRIKAAKVHTGHFDLGTTQGRKGFAGLPRGLGNTAGLQSLTLKPVAGRDRYLTATLKLKPRGFWRIGQGDQPTKFDSNGKPADLLPKLEPRVDWQTTPAKAGAAQLLIPASSIKGAMAHRLAFHANRLAGRWADAVLPAHPNYDKSNDCEEVKSLFGFACDDKTAAAPAERGQAGHLFIDDAFLAFTPHDLTLMMHNAIDRFTGGVREHMLFMEELVWKKEIAITLTLDTKGVTEAARVALGYALDDLCQGRLAIGGGAAKGHGFCNGNIIWSDGGKWLAAPPSPAPGSTGQPNQEAA
jgi:CRISPR/Cas system CSM-associated protein Csm3 (group 7 of RAMP superfamily)